MPAMLCAEIRYLVDSLGSNLSLRRLNKDVVSIDKEELGSSSTGYHVRVSVRAHFFFCAVQSEQELCI